MVCAQFIALLKKFAAALGVETIALMDPTTETLVGAMYALFQMEEKYNLKIVEKDGYYCLQFSGEKYSGMNRHLRKWYEIRKELDESLPNLTDEERRKKNFDYNMFKWTYPDGTARNARKKYYEHPINRMQEIQEDQARSEAFRKKLLQDINDSEE